MNYFEFLNNLFITASTLTINSCYVRRLENGHFWVQKGADVYVTPNIVHAYQAAVLGQFAELFSKSQAATIAARFAALGVPQECGV